MRTECRGDACRSCRGRSRYGRSGRRTPLASSLHPGPTVGQIAGDGLIGEGLSVIYGVPPRQAAEAVSLAVVVVGDDDVAAGLDAGPFTALDEHGVHLWFSFGMVPGVWKRVVRRSGPRIQTPGRSGAG